MDKSMFTLYPNFILTSGLDILSITTHFIIMMRTFKWTMCYMVLDAGDTTTASSSGGGLATVVAGVRAMGQAIGGTVVLRFINSSQPQDVFQQNVRQLLQEVQVSARGRSTVQRTQFFGGH
ncbi:hypothetical protein RvY_16207 [Ramazzottius varieornatus]|uniref:Uncharacterized protein n=1 Tax=Ramazzottius varieornatus TaxID=947166 RepID=A0A1D1VXM7_RAMVA|nr:hypothetical protein RvY_16207 [Ramazzottius varieornatus]